MLFTATSVALALPDSVSLWPLRDTVLLNGSDVKTPNLKPPVTSQALALWKGCPTDDAVDKAIALFEPVLKVDNGVDRAHGVTADELPTKSTVHTSLLFAC